MGVWYAGWHAACDEDLCAFDTSDAGTQGSATKKEALALLRQHKREGCHGQDGRPLEPEDG